MGGQGVLILCVSVITAVQASHMQGGSMSFRAREKYGSDGWVVDFKYKTAFTYPYYGSYWFCNSGDCGSEFQNTMIPLENRTSYPSTWYQEEGYMKRYISIDKPFQLRESSCCWVYNVYTEGGWELLTTVDLGTRSDTKKPNASPVTTIIPVLRIPQNCASSIKLLAHDPDGDHVTCRYGYYYGECGLCNHYFHVDQRSCVIYFPSWTNTGSYVMEMVLEDFPIKNIHLTYYDRTVAYKYSPFYRKTRAAPNKPEKYWTVDYETLQFTNEDVTNLVTETSVDMTSLFSTVVTDPHFYTMETTTAVTIDSDETTQQIFTEAVTYSTTPEYYVETTSFPEVTEQISTESVTYSTTSHETPQYDRETPGFQETTQQIFTGAGTYSTTPEYYVETNGFQEATQQTFTEAVTFPYETTRWDFYPTAYPPYYTNSLSGIPLQFIIEVTSPAPTCGFGEYRPRFLSPTPIHGTKLLVNAGKQFQLHLTAHAAYDRIEDFKVSGLPDMTKTFKSTSQFDTSSIVVEWTPTEDNIGEHVPVCFVAETTNGYQSELRCVVVVVGPSKLANTTLFCNENNMTLIIAKSEDAEINDVQFRLNDPNCLVSSNSTHFIASVEYNSCGTVTEETEEDIVFKNTAVDYDLSVIITRQNGISIPFNCSFPKKNRVSASFRAHKSIYEFTEAGFGNFTYKFQFFTDNQFVEVNTMSPVEVILRELLYMEIEVSSSVPNVQLFVESCKATPHDTPSDPIFYDIIQNGCIKDNTVVVYQGSRTQYRFTMEAFGFIGNYPEVYINCIVILCKMGATNTRCTQGCITKSMEASSRHRRSLVSESQQHFISQGPLSMKRATPADNGVEKTSAVNGNTLVIALSGMITVALISVTLNIYMKRSRTANYQRLNTQDF
ncbi:uncharacterized protein ACMZJ9_016810 [Mantella aurantiaca]